MRPHRSNAFAATEADPYAQVSDDFRDEPAGPSRKGPQGPLVVCLACGLAPGVGRECPHDEVFTADDPPAALREAAERLAAATLARRQAERTLRRLTERAVHEGSGSVEVAEVVPVAPRVVVTVLPAPLTGKGPSTRRRRADEAQGFFAFAAPPPEAAPVEVDSAEVVSAPPPPSKADDVAAEAEVAPTGEVAPAKRPPARAKRPRARKAVAAADELQG